MLTIALCDERVAELWKKHQQQDGNPYEQMLISNEINSWLDTRLTVMRERTEAVNAA